MGVLGLLVELLAGVKVMDVAFAAVMLFVVDLSTSVLLVVLVQLAVVELLLHPAWSCIIGYISSLPNIIIFLLCTCFLLLLWCQVLLHLPIECLISFHDTISTMASSLPISVNY